ncbi:WD40-repeat-containing domain protein [Suillus tomentosus]|nr:WD40-repeat-containing domain protein [Suillus tomentosus]
MRGHTHWVNGAVHLPGGRHIITCSLDGSLRLWDIESGTQIGEVWQDDGNGVRFIALSPNGKKIASGSEDGKVKLWDIETRKIIAKWTGHTVVVCALCWSGDGGQVASGSWDGTARVWDVDSGKNILKIKTGHEWVRAVMYSPDSSKLATGGNNVKIWDAKTGEILNILKHYNYDWVYLDSPRMSDQQDDDIIRSLTWTTDGQKLISGSYRLIRIFDTATWQQSAILAGHTNFVYAISLCQNNRLLASVSQDKTARLWNLDTNLQVGSPLGLQHEHNLHSSSLSLDGKVLVTGCENTNAYAWDVHAILKEAGLEDLLSIGIKLVSVNVSPALLLSLTMFAVRHQKTDSNKRHLKMIQEYRIHPALRSMTSHF